MRTFELIAFGVSCVALGAYFGALGSVWLEDRIDRDDYEPKHLAEKPWHARKWTRLTPLVIPAALLACQPIAPPLDDGEEQVVVFGDSLAVDSGEELQALFDQDPDHSLSLNAFGGMTFDAWRDRYPNVGDSTVVLLLGSNDLAGLTSTEARYAARRAIDAVTGAGAERVVVATISAAPALEATEVESFNTWLHVAGQKSDRYPTLDVVEWEADPSWLRDEIHYDATGQAQYAETAHHALGEQ